MQGINNDINHLIMTDLKHIEFLVTKSKELIEKQVNSYRQQHSYAGTIIGVTALFIPFFLNGLDNSYEVIQFISIIPIALFIWAILLMLSILRSKPLGQAFSVDKYQELVNKKYKEILVYELGANTSAYRNNKIITEKENKKYNRGVQLTTLGILISIILLFTNIFVKPEKAATKVQIINQSKMTDEPNNNNNEPIVIPTVPPADIEKMNEGVEPPKNIPSPPPPPTPDQK